MPKLIDYPRTSYAGAWEVADVVDDTGGKCALDTCARKLNRKVSGSFKAIVGSAVKFGLLTSKRELLTTTTLFRRIKHAYDKQEELLFHREAFLTPPLFTQLCRKFRSRELPVQMLDIMLIREFDVEEINAQSVAKAFIDGARMVGLLDERNMVADIDQLAAQQPPRRELASPELSPNSFRAEVARAANTTSPTEAPTPAPASELLFAATASASTKTPESSATATTPAPAAAPLVPQSLAATATPLRGSDAVASLFGLPGSSEEYSQPKGQEQREATREPLTSTSQSPRAAISAASQRRESEAYPTDAFPADYSASSPGGRLRSSSQPLASPGRTPADPSPASPAPRSEELTALPTPPSSHSGGFRIELSGPGLNTVLDIQDEDDLALARVLLDKIGRQLSQMRK